MDGLTPTMLQVFATLSPWAALAIVVVWGTRSLPSAFDAWKRVEETRNEGRKQEALARSKVFDDAIRAVGIAVEAMQKSDAQSREFYVKKLEDMRSGMSVQDERIHDLEEHNETLEEEIQELREEKDREIAELKKENEALKHENETLKQQLDALRKRMNGVDKKPGVTKGAK